VTGEHDHGAASSAEPGFDEEVRRAVRHERFVAVRGLLALLIVALVIVARLAFFG
jgi:hypothetical protein